MKRSLGILFACGLALLAGCATLPPGPSASALPGSGRTFDDFRADDASCRRYAENEVNGVSPGQAAADSTARSATLGAVVGAGIGALANGSHGAGVGAGIGLLMGGLIGSDAAYASAHAFQRRYDGSYQQCMYARGHKVPMVRRTAYVDRPAYRPPPPPRYYGPPADVAPYYPPPNYPPPPPR